MYRTAPVIANDDLYTRDIHNAERIGRNLVIHRTLTRDNDGKIDSIGSTWTITFFPFGAALVQNIRTRREARTFAKYLAPEIEALRLSVQYVANLVKSDGGATLPF